MNGYPPVVIASSDALERQAIRSILARLRSPLSFNELRFLEVDSMLSLYELAANDVSTHGGIIIFGLGKWTFEMGVQFAFGYKMPAIHILRTGSEGEAQRLSANQAFAQLDWIPCLIEAEGLRERVDRLLGKLAVDTLPPEALALTADEPWPMCPGITPWGPGLFPLGLRYPFDRSQVAYAAQKIIDSAHANGRWEAWTPSAFERFDEGADLDTYFSNVAFWGLVNVGLMEAVWRPDIGARGYYPGTDMLKRIATGNGFSLPEPIED